MWTTIAQFTWIDVVDVLIVTFAVYQLFLMFKGTRALQMILGLALVYLASRIALKGGLLTVNWVLQNLLSVWFLLIIILFQPELGGPSPPSAFVRVCFAPLPTRKRLI